MKTLAFGEILWDIIGSDSCIGGAAFNVAAHLAKLGAESHIASAVGDDRLGDAAISCAKEFGMKTGFIERRPGVDTGTVTVKVSPDGQPSYAIHENVAWDFIETGCDELESIARTPWDFFIFGTLAQRSESNRRTLDKILDALPAKTKTVYDINLRQDFHRPEWIAKSLKRCSILKINEDEAQFLGAALSRGTLKLSNRELAELLLEKHKLDTVIITLGGEGACALSEEGWTAVPGIKVKVADTVGAGDSFTAATLFAMAHGWNRGDAVAFGIKMGGFVASQRGAVPNYSDELLAEIAKIEAGPKA